MFLFLFLTQMIRQCLLWLLGSNQIAPTFDKGDVLIVSPDVWTRSGDIAAVEYGNETPVKAIMQVTYTDDFIVLESVNHKHLLLLCSW